LYRSLDELQSDLDRWLEYYNTQRVHSGKYCDGRTPWVTFRETKYLADEKMIDTFFPGVSDNAVQLSADADAR